MDPGIVPRSGPVGVEITVGAEGEPIGGAARGGGLGPAVAVDVGSHVLEGEAVGRVHVAVAREAEAGGVSTAVDHRRRLGAVVAGDHLVGSSPRGSHPAQIRPGNSKS